MALAFFVLLLLFATVAVVVVCQPGTDLDRFIPCVDRSYDFGICEPWMMQVS
jgi:hypothetical protein